MKVMERINVSIGLSATPASQANFGVPMLLVDHADVPIDRRYRIVTRSSYATNLTASTAQFNWCAAFWGQNYNGAQAYIGRWVSAASSPYIAFPSAVTTLATWTAITTGYLKITDGTNEDEIGPLNFSSVTSMADVCQVIETALQAIATPNITGLDTATCDLDALDRPTITNSTTGASAASISTTAASTGTDLRGTSYLGPGFSQAGLDAEALGTAMNAILALDNTPFVMCQSGANTAQAVAFSTAVNSLEKIYVHVETSTDAKNSGITTDAGYQIEALSHQKTYMIYTEHHTDNGAAAIEYPDAAILGEILPQAEASVSFANTAISGVSESGLHADGTTVIPLTSTEIAALEAKGYDYLINPAGSTHLSTGLVAGGNELRLMIAKSFMAAKVAEDCYGYVLANRVVTYSDADIQAIKGIISYWADVLTDRKALDSTTYSWNMPAASSFTSAVKATHTLTLSDVFSVEVQSAVNDMVITMSFTV